MQQTAYAKFMNERRAAKRKAVTHHTENRTVKSCLKDACRSLIAFLFTQVGVCALVVAYNIVGAYAFHALEGVAGDATPELTADEALNVSVTSLWLVTERRNTLEEAKWREDVTATLKIYQDILVPLIKHRGYRGVHPSIAWSPPAALMYSLSVYTTIGYGNLAPRTGAGKIVTIIYAVFGMPLMLLYMANVGEVLAKIFKFIYFRACRCDVGSLGYHRNSSGALVPITAANRRQAADEQSPSRRRSNTKDKSSFYKPRMSAMAALVAESGMLAGSIGGGKSAGALLENNPRRTIPITWALLVLAVYVTLGGMLFAKWEDWSLLDGCYFCYISLSTIGFGDLVPGRIIAGDDNHQVESKQIICTIYLLVGMALVAMCFNLMQEDAIENLKTFWRSLGCFKKNVKRGRDKLRGKKRRSRAFEDLGELEMRAIPQWQGRRYPRLKDSDIIIENSPHSSRINGEVPQKSEDRSQERAPERKSYNEQINRLYREIADESPRTSVKSSKEDKNGTLNDVDAIIVSDYDREYDILRSMDQSKKLSEINRTKKQTSFKIKREQLELKFFRDSKSKRWQKQEESVNRT